MAVKYHILPTITSQDTERFWAKVVIQPTGCWEWQAAHSSKGYGRVTIRQFTYTASRVAYFLYYTTDPREWHVLHHCDNPPCVNPLHLFLGTQKDNIHDMMAKGRMSTTHDRNNARGEKHGHYTHPERMPRGESHGNTTLTTADVIKMRQLHTDGYTYRTLGDMFHMHRSSVWQICIRRRWGHIP